MIVVNKPKAVFPLQDYLPHEGEVDVVIEVSRAPRSLSVLYVSVMCDADGGSRKCVLNLVFEGVAHFLRLPCLSRASLLKHLNNHPILGEALVAYEYSDMARDAFSDSAKHFRMLFDSLEIELHVVAETFYVVEQGEKVAYPT